MSSEGLVDFLRARLEEKERRARECSDWTECGPDGWETDEAGNTYGCPAHPSVKLQLAEVAAVRDLLERLDLSFQDFYVGSTAEDVVLGLALAYADHPEFRSEWRL